MSIDNDWWIDKMCDSPEFINEYMNEYVGNFDIGEKSNTSMLIMNKIAQDIINVQPIEFGKWFYTKTTIEQEEFFKEEEFNL